MTHEKPKKNAVSKPKYHILITLGLALSAIAFTIVMKQGLNLDQKQIPSALLQKPAKDFSVAWLQGKDILGHSEQTHLSLSDLKGRPMIVNFWASWCFSCRQEARDFEAFWQRYRTSGLVVVGIAIQDTPEAALGFARQYGKSYILGLDEDGKAAIDYGVTGVPETFVVNREGKVIYKEAGPMTAEKLSEIAEKLF